MAEHAAMPSTGVDQAGEYIRREFLNFLNQYSPEEEGMSTQGNTPAEHVKDDYIFRLKQMKEATKTTLPVDYIHVADHSPILADAILNEYYRFEPYVRKAVQNFVREHADDYVSEENKVKEFWVSFYNLPAVSSLRDLRTECVGKLMAFSGTVTRTSEVRPELLYGSFTCLECGTVVNDVEQQFKYTQPTVCENATCGNKFRWQLNREESKFVDWQRVRIQESSDEVPAGSLPRTIDVILRNEQVEIARAGDKCVFSGSLIVVPDTGALSAPGERAEGRGSSGRGARGGGGGDNDGVTGLKALGVRDLVYKLCFLATTVQQADLRFGVANIRGDGDDQMDLTPEEEDQIERMRSDPQIYKKLMDSVAPTVFGHADVKRAVLLMLFGGVHKDTGEGIALRGDINVLIVGDPSCAKSQFLKYVSGFLPRAVYTSGKTSSAAGLTATVAKEPETGEFCIEAGALMLADNGICCIDEFDKMDVKDQVAIHEAMEQQTISIAKAGIQATLNARTSILAAANPSGGRYDSSRTFSQNLQMPPAILSRFDLVHVMMDVPDDVNDHRIARHIVNVHQSRGAAIEVPYSTEDLQKYIRYARSIKPMISPKSQKMLTDAYVRLRSVQANPNHRTGARVTVRQLEALVRLSEALARLQCSFEVTEVHVREALRLIEQTQVKVDAPDVNLATEEEQYGEGGYPEEDGAGAPPPGEGDEGAGGEGGGAGGAGGAEGTEEEDEAEGGERGQGGARAQPEGAAAAAAAAAEAEEDRQGAQEGGAEQQEGGSKAEPKAEAPAAPKPKAPAPTVSQDKFNMVRDTLLRKLRSAEREAAEAGVEDKGVTQKDLTTWYIDDLTERGEVGDIEVMSQELMLVQRIIQHLVRKDQVLVDLGVPEDAAVPEGESAAQRARRMQSDRLLAISPNYVPV